MTCCRARVLTNEPQIPAGSKSPAEVQQMFKDLNTSGVRLLKVNSRNVVEERTLFKDPDSTKLFYKPTKKPPGEAFIVVRDIWELHVGRNASYILSNIQYGDQLQTGLVIRTKLGKEWNLICDSKAKADKLCLALATLVRSQRAMRDHDPVRARILDMWLTADSDGSGALSLKELSSVLARMNVSLSPRDLRAAFQKFDKDNSGTLEFEEFVQFFVSITEREELRPLFRKYAVDANIGIRREAFYRFLRLEQFEESPFPAESAVALGRSDDLFAQIAGEGNASISFFQFCLFLTSASRNSVLEPAVVERVADPMDRPLHEYFIDSSHNTYLSGDQLQSESRVEMYRRALLAGCRCVELDCWDGPNGDPVVYHGYTRTSKIRFYDIIEAIKQTAFVKSSFPVILSLEVHTSHDQSVTMSKVLRSVLGPLLLLPSDPEFAIYTPEALQRRVLVKWKLNPADDDDDKDREGQTGTEQNTAIEAPAEAEKQQHKGCFELSAVVTCGAHKTKDFGASAKPFYIQSYTESKVEEFAKKCPQDFTRQNMRMMSRIYPKGTRINSSNYDPMLSWSLGCQVVALNYQTWDEPMRLNDGFFSRNKRCGYVLKPAYLREADSAVSPIVAQHPILKVPGSAMKLQVTVMMGSQLPKPNNERKGEIVDPYVVARVVTKGDQKNQPSLKTHTVDNNGFSPAWNGPTATATFVIADPELAVLAIDVFDKDLQIDDHLCSSFVPVVAIRRGYRSIPLRVTTTGEVLPFSSILCHFSCEPI